MTKNTPRLPWYMLIFAMLAMIAYHMPWHLHSTAAFSNNAFDLAEAASLHPHVRNESPALYTSLLLRLPILFLAFIVVLNAARLNDERARWFWRGVAVLFVLRLNPPVEFYPYGSGSINDQQLGKLMIAGLFIVAILSFAGRWLKFLYHPLMLIATAVMPYLGNKGLERATDLFENGLALELDTGAGLIFFVGLSITAHIYIWWHWLWVELNLNQRAIKPIIQRYVHKGPIRRPIRDSRATESSNRGTH